MAKKIDITLLPYQMDLLRSKARYKGFIGGTGSGKTFFTPLYLLTKMSQKKRSTWIVSSPSYGMGKRTIWKYIHNTFKMLEIKYKENKSDMVIEYEYGEIIFISAETYERMQGIHVDGIIGDEAGLYKKEWWDTAVQRVAYKKGEILLTTTPYSANHWLKTDFYDEWISGNDDFFVVNPRSIDNPFYPRKEYERAKRRLPAWKFALLFDAVFPESNSNHLFTLNDIEGCMKIEPGVVNELMENDDIVITVDVAREGNDLSVIVTWKGYEMQKIRKIEKNTLRELAGYVREEFESAKDEYGVDNDDEILIVVDMTGLGVGLYEELYYDTGLNVYGVKFSENADDSGAYKNVRAEMYFLLAEAVENRRVRFIEDDDLIEDLLVQERRLSSDGRFLLKSKEEIKKALGKSPDVSDAVALRFAPIKSKVGIL